MIRVIIIAGAALLILGGVAFAMSRPEVADPGPPVLRDSTLTGATTTPDAVTTAVNHDADHDRDDAREADDTKADRDDTDEDEFQVATPRVKSDEEDWDDDDGIESEHDDGGSDAEED